jgi:hypothetical protein
MTIVLYDQSHAKIKTDPVEKQNSWKQAFINNYPDLVHVYLSEGGLG